MPKGSTHPPESHEFTDANTGVKIRQVTSHPSIHHHPFYYIPAYDDAMRRLIFVSHRTGIPQLFAEIRETGELLQLTDRDDLDEWSIHPSHDGNYVYFTAGMGGWRIELKSLKEEQLLDFGTDKIREKGMVGAAMGTTTLSRDDNWWAVPVKRGDSVQFVVVDTSSGKSEVILERDTIGHPQFHPDDPTWLRYAGPYHSRIWVIRRDGSDDRLVYERNVAKKEWIVHETWRPGSMEILTANWPHGVIGIDVETGNVRQACTFNAWHPVLNRDGTQMVADTKNPDTGIHLFAPLDGTGKPQSLCASEATNAGDHWNVGHCPYDDGPIDVYAPQHTHPHPNFAPSGKHVIFTSDKSGHAQLYEVML